MESIERKIQILVADNHAMFREGLRRLLEGEPDLHVVADTGDGDQVKDLAVDLKPDIVLLDVNNLRSRSGRSGMQILRGLTSATPNLRTILLTAAVDKCQMVETLKLGVCGVMRKKSGAALLFKCIRSVMAGGYWISRDATSELVRSFTSLNTRLEHGSKLLDCRFSRREFQVLRAIVDGYSNKDIANEMSVSEQAVKYHLTNIFRKAGVSGRMELARFTIDHRLVRESSSGDGRSGQDFSYAIEPVKKKASGIKAPEHK
jgi:DNA-binding NarL/FixJ family response regulator